MPKERDERHQSEWRKNWSPLIIFVSDFENVDNSLKMNKNIFQNQDLILYKYLDIKVTLSDN